MRKQERGDHSEHEAEALPQMPFGFLLYAYRRDRQIYDKYEPKRTDEPDKNCEAHFFTYS